MEKKGIAIPTLRAVWGLVSFSDSTQNTWHCALLQLKAFHEGETRSKESGSVCRLKSVMYGSHAWDHLFLRTHSVSSFLFLFSHFFFFCVDFSRLWSDGNQMVGVNARTRHGVSTNFRVQLMHLSDGQKGSQERGGKIIETSLSLSHHGWRK